MDVGFSKVDWTWHEQYLYSSPRFSFAFSNVAVEKSQGRAYRWRVDVSTVWVFLVQQRCGIGGTFPSWLRGSCCSGDDSYPRGTKVWYYEGDAWCR